MNFLDAKGASRAPATMPAKARRGLFRKYVAFFIGTVCLALVSNDLLDIHFLIRDYSDFSIRLQQEQARAAASRIDQFIKDIEAQIRWTTQLPWAAATLEEWRFDAARLFRQAPAITEYVKLDANGREQLRVSRLGPDLIGSGDDLSQNPAFTSALASMVYHGPVSFRRESEPYMTISISAPGNEVTLAEVNLKFVWDLVSQIKVGQRGKAYVVDDKGRLIAHPDLSLVLRNTDASQLSQVRAARAGEPAAPPQDEQSVEDLDGRQVLAAAAPVAGLNWLLLVELPLDEALAPLHAAILRLGLVLVAAFVIATLAGLLLARKMVVPIQALRDGAMRIGGGDFEQRISIKTGDELETLADQFNEMAAQLYESQVASRNAMEKLSHMNRVATAGELSASIAHEINQPLTAIVTNANAGLRFLAHATPDVDEARAALKSVVNDGHRASAVVESIRTMFKKGDESKVPLDINELIQGVLGLMRIELQAQGVIVQFESDTQLPLVLGHGSQLQQVILNLVNNSADAMNSVLNRARILRVKSTIHDSNNVVVSIEDSGMGIDPKDIDHLFESFFTTKSNGMGMGLSICRSIIEAHHGRLWATPAFPHGAIFYVALPGADTMTDPVKQQPELRPAVFVVEDESARRDVKESILRQVPETSARVNSQQR